MPPNQEGRGSFEITRMKIEEMCGNDEDDKEEKRNVEARAAR
jgi:hypothetical protein